MTVLCPICGAPAEHERPDLRLLGWHCPACGWYFTPPHERPPRDTDTITEDVDELREEDFEG